MEFTPTLIAGCFRIELQPFRDARGDFVGVFDLETMRKIDSSFQVLRVNRSLTKQRGAIRGLHLQRPPMDEAKLVQCVRGSVFDVCVDARPESPTYRRWVGLVLSAENMELSLIPRGCAHGFQALTENCVVEYFVTGLYSPQHETGFRWNDPALGISWPLPCTLTSEKDAAWPLLPEALTGR